MAGMRSMRTESRMVAVWVKLSTPGLKPSINHHINDPPARAHARTRPEHDVKLLDPCSHATAAQARSAIPGSSPWSCSTTSSSTALILESIVASLSKWTRWYLQTFLPWCRAKAVSDRARAWVACTGAACVLSRHLCASVCSVWCLLCPFSLLKYQV